MCFSTQASFGAGALLAVAGVLAIKKATKPAHKLFAAIPLLFALQQFAEGFLWIALTSVTYAHWKVSAMYIFLFFAQVIWPLWVPLAIWQLEKNAARKKTLFVLFCIGVFTSGVLAYFLLAYPINTQINGAHIFYELGYPGISMKLAVLYFIPTVISSFLSTYRGVQLMGLAILTSFIVSKLFFKEELISVWCYFAAIISVVILFIMHGIKKSGIASVK